MLTGAGVLDALAKLGYSVKDVTITRKGEWLHQGFVRTPHQALLGCDAAFIALHGFYGEDGQVQRILERLGVPYTGSDAYASALAMNKALTKEFLKKEGSVRMAPHIRINRENTANLAQIVFNVTELFGPHYVVKPVGGGSSIGTRIVSKPDLFAAVNDSLAEMPEVLVEQKIEGKEATVGIIEGFRGRDVYDLPPIEIIPPASAGFFSAEVKYNGQTEEIAPGRFSRTEKETLGKVAAHVHRTLGLRQYSRSDFIVADDGVYFLEVNTLPGLTAQSLFPKAMESVGSSYQQLVGHLIATL
jgi:D-alanine-D-alanine ligase